MKKLATILLLVILIFNLAGYSFLFQYYMNRADVDMVKQLDATAYNESDLIQVKVPLHMPYITTTGNFERANGELEHEGVHYNYVKRKITNDTLYILCLPNTSKTTLYNAKIAYGKEVNDVPNGKKNTESFKKISLASEYNVVTNPFTINGFLSENVIAYSNSSVHLPQNLKAIPEQPPRKVFC